MDLQHNQLEKLTESESFNFEIVEFQRIYGDWQTEFSNLEKVFITSSSVKYTFVSHVNSFFAAPFDPKSKIKLTFQVQIL